MNTLPRPLTLEQFEAVRPMLEHVRKKTRPRTHDLYDITCAVLHKVTTGVPWRSLPPGFPPWRTIHEYHTIWTMPPRDGGSPMLDRIFAAMGERRHRHDSN